MAVWRIILWLVSGHKHCRKHYLNGVVDECISSGNNVYFISFQVFSKDYLTILIWLSKYPQYVSPVSGNKQESKPRPSHPIPCVDDDNNDNHYAADDDGDDVEQAPSNKEESNTSPAHVSLSLSRRCKSAPDPSTSHFQHKARLRRNTF